MDETGNDICHLQTKYDIKEETYPIPAFLRKHKLYVMGEEKKLYQTG